MSKSPDKLYQEEVDDDHGLLMKSEVEALIAAAVADYEAIEAPSCQSESLDGTKKIVTLVYDKNIYSNVADAAALKAATTIATDGATFSALGASDTVAITDNVFTVTFDSVLSTATNKITIDADTFKDALGNVQDADYVTAVLDAS